MSYKIIAVPRFQKEIKKLSNKYPSLKADFAILIDSLEENPTQGISLGLNCYKIRFAITSKGKGKSGGGRIITYVYISEKTVYLLSIYDKSEKESISDKEILDRLKDLK